MTGAWVGLAIWAASGIAATVILVSLCRMAAKADEQPSEETLDDRLASMTWDFGSAGWRN